MKRKGAEKVWKAQKKEREKGELKIPQNKFLVTAMPLTTNSESTKTSRWLARLLVTPKWQMSVNVTPPGQLSLAIPSQVSAMSTSQRAVTPCGWGVKAGMVRVCVAGKTVWSHCYTRAILEHFGDTGLIIKHYIDSSVYLYFYDGLWISSLWLDDRAADSLMLLAYWWTATAEWTWKRLADGFSKVRDQYPQVPASTSFQLKSKYS